jgi:hypothetical protein
MQLTFAGVSRAERIIDSCQTRAQLIVAWRYAKAATHVVKRLQPRGAGWNTSVLWSLLERLQRKWDSLPPDPDQLPGELL